MTLPRYLLLLPFLIGTVHAQCYQFVAGDKTVVANITNLPPQEVLSLGGITQHTYNLLRTPGNSVTLTVGGRRYVADQVAVIIIQFRSTGDNLFSISGQGLDPSSNIGYFGALINGSADLPRDRLPTTLPPLSANWGGQITTSPDRIGNVTRQDYFTVTSQQVGCSAANPNQPTFATSGALVNGASFQPEFAAGTWLTIRGAKLSATTRTWEATDFNGRSLPTSLDGVQVRINNRPAYVYYVSPEQINVLAPDDPTTGPVPVQVITRDGPSAIITVNKSPVAPALFSYSAQAGRYVIAQDAVSYALVGPPNLLGPAATLTPARPGQTITLYATGLGATNPAVPTGELVAAPAPLAAPLQVTIGGQPATVTFAGLVSSGLYQINAVVPEASTGDALIEVRTGGGRSQAGYIAVLNPRLPGAPGTYTISRVAGTGAVTASSGDGGPATSAGIGGVSDVLVDGGATCSSRQGAPSAKSRRTGTSAPLPVVIYAATLEMAARR